MVGIKKDNSKYNLLVVLGPTASGKTTLATALAANFKGEILSADSRQVYRGMDLGTGKDISEYIIDGKQIPYHLIDIVNPGYKYNVFEYQADFFKAYNDIIERKVWPIMCGGSGLYIEAVLKKYKLINVPVNKLLREQLVGKSLVELESILKSYKKLHNNTDTDTIKRAIRSIEIEDYYEKHADVELELPEIRPLVVGVDIERELRRKRITQRLQQRIDEGMIQEVEGILNSGVTSDDLIYYGLEYKFITLYLLGQLSFDDMFNSLNVAIHQFAKRQMTWYRRMEKQGIGINWIDAEMSLEEKINKVESLLI